MRINENSASLLNTIRNRASFCWIHINMFFESNFLFKIVYWDRNRSFKVVRTSIKEDYLVPIKKFYLDLSVVAVFATRHRGS